MILRKLVLSLLLVCSTTVSNATPDVSPYVKWILDNTRFGVGTGIPRGDYPKIVFLSSDAYEKESNDSLGMYIPKTNTVYINRDYYLIDDSVIVHEMVHFFQIAHGPIPPCVEHLELEAYEIQLRYLSVKPTERITSIRAHRAMTLGAYRTIKKLKTDNKCTRLLAAPAVDVERTSR